MLLLLTSTDLCFCISAPGTVSGWVNAFPLQDGSRQVRLEWSSVAGATGYKVYRQSFAKGGSPLGAPPKLSSDAGFPVDVGSNTSFTDGEDFSTDGLDNDYWYVYQITAYGASEESTGSPEGSYGIFVPQVRLKWEEKVE